MNLKDIQVAIVGKLSDRLMAKVESTFTAYRAGYSGAGDQW
ncbi:hypothetical protein [Escherichia coli]|nr:hypothetical protein [Escherichia coli]